MDVKVSKKEKIYQPDGIAMVLKDHIFDLFPIYGNPLDQNIVTDIEILDGEEEERLDRATFSVIKQRGLDPLELQDGIPWAETVLGEVPAVITLAIIKQAVVQEGPGVSVQVTATKTGTNFKVGLTK